MSSGNEEFYRAVSQGAYYQDIREWGTYSYPFIDEEVEAALLAAIRRPSESLGEADPTTDTQPTLFDDPEGSERL